MTVREAPGRTPAGSVNEPPAAPLTLLAPSRWAASRVHCTARGQRRARGRILAALKPMSDDRSEEVRRRWDLPLRHRPRPAPRDRPTGGVLRPEEISVNKRAQLDGGCRARVPAEKSAAAGAAVARDVSLGKEQLLRARAAPIRGAGLEDATWLLWCSTH